MALPHSNKQISDTTQIALQASTAAANASDAANAAAQAAKEAANNASIAAKAAAESATAIAVVATDTSWIKKTLTRVEETLGEMGKSFVTQSDHKDVLIVLEDHEKRIRTTETERTRITLLLSVCGVILTTLVGILVKHLFQS